MTFMSRSPYNCTITKIMKKSDDVGSTIHGSIRVRIGQQKMWGSVLSIQINIQRLLHLVIIIIILFYDLGVHT